MAARRSFCMVIDDEDKRLLDACAEQERLSRATIVRLALRRFAKQIGADEARNEKPELALASGG